MASVTMPQLGESITEGTISKWLKKPGDQVRKYESLVEVITDKVSAEVPSPLSGTLEEIKVAEGTTVAVGTEICVIAEVGAKSGSPSTSAAEGLGGHAGMIPEPGAGPARELTATAASASPSPSTGEGRGGGAAATRLSPAVRALIEEHRISDAELSTIAGSGIGGRISKKDVEEYVAAGRRAAPDGKQRQPALPSPSTAASQRGAAAATPSPSMGEGRGGGDTAIALSPMRRAIAVNMAKSKQAIPHA